ncbi:MAG: C25 family cysteine peptidase [Thermoplasmatota archaeon]
MLRYTPHLDITITTADGSSWGGENLYRGTPEDIAAVADMVCNPSLLKEYRVFNEVQDASFREKPGHRDFTGTEDPARIPVHRIYDETQGTVSTIWDDDEITISVPPSGAPVGSTAHYDYVIITTDYLASYTGSNSFYDLISSKIDKGLSATMVTVEDITSNSSFWDVNPVFNDTQAQIRNFIRHAYLNWGTEYVLLGGDSDDGSPVVPARDLYVESWSGGYTEYMPSDLYYACLDGNYNWDEDQRWGEPTDGDSGGDVDLMAEVYVGRAPVQSHQEVANFVMKTLWYENSSHPYLRDVCMAGELLWSDPTWGGDYMDELINGSCANGYCTVGVPGDLYNISTLYDRDWPGNNSWPKSEIIQYMNDGTHMINHLGHANSGYVMKMYNSDADALTNTEFFFAYSQGCIAGAFDDNDCIAEHFTVKTGHGAFAVIMNARYGWGVHASTDGASQHYHREFIDAIYNESLPELGRANQDSKTDNLWRINGDCMRWCCYELNLFGDPEIAIKPAYIPEVDVGVQAINDPVGYNCLGYYTVNATIKNYGNTSQTFNVTCQIYNTTTWTEVYNDTNQLTLASGNYATTEFTPAWHADTEGDYAITVWTNLSGDEVPGNDLKNATVYMYNISDVGTVYIHYPYDIITIGNCSVNATVANFGTLNQSLVPVNCSIYNVTQQTFFLDDMESGSNGWTTLATSGSDLWHLSNQRSNSPSTAWYCANESTGEYEDDMLNFLISPAINLSGASGSMVSFATWFDLEMSWDYGYVCASPDNSTFYILKEYTGNSGGWMTDSVDVTSCINETTGLVNIGFVMYTDGSVQWYDGWFIDDVEVYTLSPHVLQYSDEIPVNLTTGEYRDIEFAAWDASPGMYIVDVTSNLTGDENTGNDAASRLFQVLPDQVYVDDDFNVSTPGWGVYNFSSIQDAIDNVAPGGRVFVFNGTYGENVMVYQPVNITGESMAGVTVQATGGSAFSIQSDFVTLDNFAVSSDYGTVIYADYSQNLLLSRINVANWNYVDIYSCSVTVRDSSLRYLDCYNSVLNLFNNTVYYIWLDYSSGTIANNSVVYYCRVWASSYNQIENNSFGQGIWLEGYMLEHYLHTIQNNDVNGRPLYYYVSQSDLLVSDNDIGEIILVDCYNVSITDSVIYDAGIEVAFSDEITIDYTILQNVYRGVFASTASTNILIDNNTIQPWQYGVYTFSNTNEYPIYNLTITHNDITYASYGCCIGHASHTTLIRNNNISDGYIGVYLRYGVYNIDIVGNNLDFNDYGIRVYGYDWAPVFNSTITLNTISNSYQYGIYLYQSYGNRIYHNNFFGNSQQVYDAGGSLYNIYEFFDGTWLWTHLIGDGEWSWSYDGYSRIFLDDPSYTPGTPGPEDHWLNKTLDLSSAGDTVTVEFSLDYDGTAHTYWFTVTNGTITKNFPIVFTLPPGNWSWGGTETFSFDISEFAGQSDVTIGFHVNHTSDGNEWFEQWWLYVNSTNIWHDGYPSGGNYWNDFDEPGEGAYDNYHGPNQDLLGKDRIVDGGSLNPYIIPPVNVSDIYPLTHPWGSIPPVANFTYLPSHPTIFDTIEFNDTSLDLDGTIVNWTWDFGDGNSSYDQNPTHAYGSKGTYTVNLTVTDDDALTDTVSLYVTVANLPPTANFSYTPPQPTTADTIEFNDTSFDLDGSIVNWTWDFDDGTYSYEQNPTHKYSNSGVYEVTLTVCDDDYEYDSLNRLISVISGDWNYWSNSPHMYSMNEGNVGIGTDSPTDKLHVNGSFRVESNPMTHLFFVDASTDRIGIGTGSPAATLDVQGGIRSLNGLQVDNNQLTGIFNTQSNRGLTFSGGSNAADGARYQAYGGTHSTYPGLCLFDFGSQSHDITTDTTFRMRFRSASGGNTDVFHVYGRYDTSLAKNVCSMVINPTKLDYDFRVAGTTTTHLLFVDASSNYVGIGTSTPQRALHVNDVMRLEPRATFPSSPDDGDLCVVGSEGSYHIYCYLNSNWRQLD